MWPSKDGINTARLIIRGINGTVRPWNLQRPVPARSWKLDRPGFLCLCFFPTWLNFELGKNFNPQGDCMSESLPVWCKDYEDSRIRRVQVLCEELALWLDLAYEKRSVNSSYFWRCAVRCAERGQPDVGREVPHALSSSWTLALDLSMQSEVSEEHTRKGLRQDGGGKGV